MSESQQLLSWFADTWHVWFVTITLVVAAVIDGYQLKVPNWITFPMIISGWVYSAAFSAVRWLGRFGVEPVRHRRGPGPVVAALRRSVAWGRAT